MMSWTENDSSTYRTIAPVAVPRRQEMMAALLAAVPFGAGEPLKILELGSGGGLLAEARLTRFSHATLTPRRLGIHAPRGDDALRASDRRVDPFDVAALDCWMDVRRGCWSRRCVCIISTTPSDTCLKRPPIGCRRVVCC
jgi:hypothetical protein